MLTKIARGLIAYIMSIISYNLFLNNERFLCDIIIYIKQNVSEDNDV